MEYFSKSFGYVVSKQYEPRFRVFQADDYLLHFSSDRSHMLDNSGTQYLSPPPFYDCISHPSCCCGRKLKLTDCWGMKISETIDLQELLKSFDPEA